MGRVLPANRHDERPLDLAKRSVLQFLERQPVGVARTPEMSYQPGRLDT